MNNPYHPPTLDSNDESIGKADEATSAVDAKFVGGLKLTLIVGSLGGLVVGLTGYLAADLVSAQSSITVLVPIVFSVCAAILVLSDPRCNWFWNRPFYYGGLMAGITFSATMLFAPVCFASPIGLIYPQTPRENASLMTYVFLGLCVAGIVAFLSRIGSRQLS